MAASFLFCAVIIWKLNYMSQQQFLFRLHCYSWCAVYVHTDPTDNFIKMFLILILCIYDLKLYKFVCKYAY